jgi:hypothetical protein
VKPNTQTRQRVNRRLCGGKSSHRFVCSVTERRCFRLLAAYTPHNNVGTNKRISGGAVANATAAWPRIRQRSEQNQHEWETLAEHAPEAREMVVVSQPVFTNFGEAQLTTHPQFVILGNERHRFQPRSLV